MAKTFGSLSMHLSRLLRGAPIAAALALQSALACAAPAPTAHVQAELVAERTALAPGKPITVALRLRMERGWHTYWQNPGDSGLATTIAWKLPPGMTAGPIQWPAPSALPTGPLVNYGYEGEVLLLTDIAVAPDAAPGTVATLAARADWLVCKETCIPEGADLTLALPISADTAVDAPDAKWSVPIARQRDALPRPLAGWSVAAVGKGASVELVLTPTAGRDTMAAGELHFFPYVEGQIEAAGAQAAVRDGASWKLTLPVSSQRVGEFNRVAGVLVASDGAGGRTASTIDAPLSGTIVAGAAAPAAASVAPLVIKPASGLSLAAAIAFAFVGGMLLNLMPCVFPVLSLKVLGFAAQGGGRKGMRNHGIAFATGVIVSFWLLAGLLLALRAAGAQLGWGFQLQSPLVVAALALLFFVLALNLSGVFEVGQLLPSSLANITAKSPLANDALSGALAVVIASPCSAPFMGAALGYALTENVATTFAVFSALGLGMAAPYLLLACFPGWRAKLPRPGAWMIRLKQFLAFPLYGTVVWLAWVLGAQLDNDAVARLGLTLLLVALALWSWQTVRGGGARGWGGVAVAGILVAAVVAWPVLTAATGVPPGAGSHSVVGEASDGWQAYAPERVAQSTKSGRPVFVDFTAAWCVTCQVNKRLVLNTDAVQAAFARDRVTLLRADWTRRDPEIGAALSALGRDGVPVYVLFRPGQEPLILPEVLRKQDIVDALASLQLQPTVSLSSSGG
jgi:thiol:disulfide interchange protein/DsbC/DsbD-like thiol-disulfide interchange protein